MVAVPVGRMYRQSVHRLQSLLHPALDVLQHEVTGDDTSTALRAASILLRFATPGRLERMSQKSATAGRSAG